MRTLTVGAVVATVLVAAAASAAAPNRTASCIAQPSPQPPPKVAFIGVALPGKSTGGPMKILFDPARFRVIKSYMGHVSGIVRVATSLRMVDGVQMGDSLFNPVVGQKWLIRSWGRDRRGILVTFEHGEWTDGSRIVP